MKKKKEKHTPTPWIVEDRIYLVKDQTTIAELWHSLNYSPIKDTAVPTPEEQRANGAFIIRAVNNHKILLDACEEALAFIERNTEDLVIDAKDTLRMAISKAEAL